jgi:hypothetical protein
MRAITTQECEQWAASNPGPHDAQPRTYRLDADAGARTALARSLAAAADEGLLWITGWGIFPNLENMALFDAYRRSFGEERSLSDAPGHVFDAGDREHVECIAALALYFFWDATVLTEEIAVRFGHDEWIEIRARGPEALASLARVLER